MANIAQNIKAARTKLNITQEELAQKINVTRQAVSNWENGKTEPDLETIARLAEVLEIDTCELIDNAPPKKTDSYRKNKYFPAAVIFCILAFVGLVASIILEEPATRLSRELYKSELLIFLNYVIKPLTGLFFGICFALFSEIATGFYIKNKILRISVLILGIIAAILATCFVIYFLIVITAKLPIPLNKILYYQQKIVIENPIVHVLAPILIFYGTIKK